MIGDVHQRELRQCDVDRSVRDRGETLRVVDAKGGTAD
jgi:hypothetical protein